MTLASQSPFTYPGQQNLACTLPLTINKLLFYHIKLSGLELGVAKFTLLLLSLFESFY